MWFMKKKKAYVPEVVKIENINIDDFRGDESVSLHEPVTLAKLRLEGGARDKGSERGMRMYNEHKTKIQNQWINPLQSINTGFGSAQYSFYNYQEVNYYECYSLAQDPLFNKIFNILSKTPFANGGIVSSEMSDEEQDKLQKVLRKYKVNDILVNAVRSQYVCGGCLIYMDFGDDVDLEEPLELSKMDMRKFKGFRHIDPINVVAVDVNTTEPAKSDYMKPEKWYVVGLGTCHKSHFLKFEDNIPELIMRPLCMYFGMPLTLLIKQDVSNSNLASQGMANLMNRFRYLYLKTGSENFTGMGARNFRRRLEVMSMLQDNFQVCPIKDTEEMTQLTTSVSGMDSNCEFFYQILASKTDITLSILLGKGAQGLSGTLEGERKNFYDRIRAIQEMVKPNLLKMYGIVYGKEKDGKYFEFDDFIFNPLEQSDESEKANNLKTYTEVAGSLIQMGIKQDDVINWLKEFKDFHLDDMEIDEEAKDMEDYNSYLDAEAKNQQNELNHRQIQDYGKENKTQNMMIFNDEAFERLHPRDKDGRFSPKGTVGTFRDESTEEKRIASEGVKSVLKRVAENEPEITRDVIESVEKTGADTFGLEYRLKSLKSAVGKAPREREEKPELYAKASDRYIVSSLWDNVRYSQATSKPEKLREEMYTTLNSLEKKGYKVAQIKNSFPNVNNPYKGINVKILSPKGQKMELQFNTHNNFIIKEGELHKPYEIVRSSKDKEQVEKARAQMFEIAKKFEMHDSINKISIKDYINYIKK